MKCRVPKLQWFWSSTNKTFVSKYILSPQKSLTISKCYQNFALTFIYLLKILKDIPYQLECNPGALFFIMGFWVGFNSNFEPWMTEYWVPAEHRPISNIDRLNTNTHNSIFKGFDWFKAQGHNSNFGWGSIQEWGCIQAEFLSKICVYDYIPGVSLEGGQGDQLTTLEFWT